jgi:lipopolysaccharide/colanic/teichoic acid biosynthesis glycosyltransferase
MSIEDNRKMINTANTIRTELTSPDVATVTAKKGICRLVTYRCWKAIFDRAFALFWIIVTSPLLALITLAIKLDTPGKAIFSQERVGKDGRRFIIHKFRTMHVKHDDDVWKDLITRYVRGDVVPAEDDKAREIVEAKNDRRVTRVGRLLRKTNLDELPQIFNILKGDMSFVGPRPDVTFTVDMYDEYDKQRLAVMPGLTGLWQVSGRKQVSFKEMIRRDIEYIEKQSLALDLKIFFLTIGTVLRREGS